MVESSPVVVCAVDGRYAGPLAVLLRSLGANLRPHTKADVYVIDNCIGQWNRNLIERSIDQKVIRIHWIKLHKELLCGLPVSGHIPITAYARILIPQILPEKVTKAIYLDCDTLVIGDLCNLWDMDVKGAPLLAVQEVGTTVASSNGLVLYRELGLPPETPYLNSGVLVINCAQWRKSGIHVAILRYLRENYSQVRSHDQDGINAVLATKWIAIDRKWNYRINCGEPESNTNAADYERQLSENAVILHYTSPAKPWHPKATHPSVARYCLYWRETAFWNRGMAAPWKPRKLNRHHFGAWIRKVPLVGAVWAVLCRHKYRFFPLQKK